MSNFLLYSIIGSIVLTLLVNLLPMLFPRAAQKAERKIQQTVNESLERQERGEQPRIKVFFPWKAMLIASIVLTVLVNLVGFFAGR